MRWLTLLQERFAFTRNEITVILFLSCTFCGGLALRTFRTAPPTAAQLPEFSYAVSDSIFAARSAQAHAAPGAPHGSGKKTPPSPASIHLNTASAQQLTRLPGIGPSIAQRIVEYRTDHGKFRSLDDLRNVKGIGKKKFDMLTPFIAL